MRTEFPTVEIYFVFAFTYCKLRVYQENESFARKLLEAHKVEFLLADPEEDWQEFDTRMLLKLVTDTLPELLGPAVEKAVKAGVKEVLKGE